MRQTNTASWNTSADNLSAMLHNKRWFSLLWSSLSSLILRASASPTMVCLGTVSFSAKNNYITNIQKTFEKFEIDKQLNLSELTQNRIPIPSKSQPIPVTSHSHLSKWLHQAPKIWRISFSFSLSCNAIQYAPDYLKSSVSGLRFIYCSVFDAKHTLHLMTTRFPGSPRTRRSNAVTAFTGGNRPAWAHTATYK